MSRPRRRSFEIYLQRSYRSTGIKIVDAMISRVLPFCTSGRPALLVNFVRLFWGKKALNHIAIDQPCVFKAPFSA